MPSKPYNHNDRNGRNGHTDGDEDRGPSLHGTFMGLAQLTYLAWDLGGDQPSFWVDELANTLHITTPQGMVMVRQRLSSKRGRGNTDLEQALNQYARLVVEISADGGQTWEMAESAESMIEKLRALRNIIVAYKETKLKGFQIGNRS